ncbi:hypothetical protein CK203_115054 [Vitis vinifera]|uniref:Retrotransposon gag domain-containing protein n=1 Tax=Vitis vinifera TaxID=29760 RepID=A0A438CBC5_VITVI|nr:hypothetical protein CK203_115054 [Vitis vinifera]
MRARLGPQEPGKIGPPAAATWEAYPNPQSHPLFKTTSHTNLCDKSEGTHQMNHPLVPLAEDWMICSPRLLGSHIIHYDHQGDSTCQNFLRMMGLVTPSDHIMHYRQLMTFDIGNDALLCKGPIEAFVGQYLCSTRHKQNISTLQNIKMQENESLREFVKRFGQAVLQVEAYNMNDVLQIFKRSICSGTPFFESLAKKPPTTMDDLFRRVSKYSMLENDVRATTSKFWLPTDIQKRRGKKFQTSGPAKAVWSKAGEQSCPELPLLMPLSISYEKLLPMIQDLSNFRWPGPIRTDLAKRDHSKKCAYHKERCRSLHYLVKRLIKAGHLKQYLRSEARVRDTP